MRAPWIGGDEYMGLIMALSWLSSAAFSSLLAQTALSAPTRSP